MYCERLIYIIRKKPIGKESSVVERYSKTKPINNFSAGGESHDFAQSDQVVSCTFSHRMQIPPHLQ